MLYMFVLVFVLVHVLLVPPSRVEGFGMVNSLLIGSTTHLILRWIRSPDALGYMLSCPKGECEMETVKESSGSSSLDVFSMEDITIILTAFYPCNWNTTQQLDVTLPGTVLPSTTTSMGTAPTVATQSSSAGNYNILVN